MFYSFKKYSIQYVCESIEIDNRTFDSYVEIHLQNEYNHQLTTLKKGVLNWDTIEQQFNETQELNFDHCYIKDFDIEKLYLSDSQNSCLIKHLSAKNAVFESDTEINFSKIELEQDILDFSFTYILKGKLNFHASILAKKTNDFSNIVFNAGNVDFANSIFGKEKNNFKNSVFNEGFKNFQYTDFSSGEANFTNVHFGSGDVSFINANFKTSKPVFKVATFDKGKVDFHYSQFGDEDISFERVNFGDGTVDFSKVDFGKGKVNFNRSFFNNGEVSFEGIELINGKLTFKKASFSNNSINFSEASCAGSTLLFQSAILGNSTINFFNSVAENISFRSCHLNNYVDFRVKQVHIIDLRDCVVRDILDFIPYENDVQISVLNIDGMRLIGKIFIDWEKNEIFNIINRQKNSDHLQKAYQYRLLKENFHNTGEYEAEDKAYIYFKRNESKSILFHSLKKSNLNKLSAYLSYYFKDLLLDKAGLYATSPVRVLWSMLISYIFFSLLLVFTSFSQLGDLTGSSEHHLLSVISDSLYFSIITYLTIGYGDFCPLGIDRWIAGIEGFVGVFLMAYFTVAFVRRILR